MTDKDYKDGYNDGFKEGYDFGKKAATPPSSPYNIPDWLRQQGSGTNCSVCGMFFEAGKAYGYVCPNLRCPSKTTCVTPLGTTGVVTTTRATTNNIYASASATANAIPWSSWMSGRPSTSFTDNMNYTPDGMSYEEIYGSVVYQQNKKKEE